MVYVSAWFAALQVFNPPAKKLVVNKLVEEAIEEKRFVVVAAVVVAFKPVKF